MQGKGAVGRLLDLNMSAYSFEIALAVLFTREGKKFYNFIFMLHSASRVVK